MKSLKSLLVLAAALGCSTVASAQWQSLKLIVVGNAANGQNEYVNTLFFDNSGSDSTDAGDQSISLNTLGANDACFFTVGSDNAVHSFYDHRQTLSAFTTITTGLYAANPTTIRVTADYDASNLFLGMGYAYLRQISTGAVYSLMNNDTITLSIPANDGLTSDFQIVCGPRVLPESYSESCFETHDGGVEITNPNCSNWNYIVYDSSNAIAASANVTTSYVDVSGLGAGNYTVVSYINNFMVDSSSFTLNAQSPVIAGFSADLLTAFVNENINFTNSSSANAVSYAWDFGDGNTSTDMNPSHSFSTTGLFNVVLTVTSPAGCQSSSTVEIGVNNGNSIAYKHNTNITSSPERIGNTMDVAVITGNQTIVLDRKNDETVTSAQVYDLGGQLISASEFSGQNVTVQVPKTGVYIVRVVRANGEYLSRQVMVNEQ